MRKQASPRIQVTQAVNRLLLLGALLLLAAMSGCNKLATWRNQQVATSHQLAQGNKITPPSTPVQVPDDVRAELPLDPSFTTLSYSESGGEVRMSLLSAWDTTKTCEWLLTQMQQWGYEIGDNPSRILEGLDFTYEKAKYKRVRITVSLNTEDQTTVAIEAYPEG